MAQQETRDQVRQILNRIAPEVTSGLSDDTDIFSAGIDSVNAMLIITEIEKGFDISLEVHDIPYERFRTIADIAAFIASIKSGDEPFTA